MVMQRRNKTWWLIGLSSILALPFNATMADREDRGEHHEHNGRNRHWRGDIKHFHRHDFDRWRHGRWVYETHDGHMGWWWVVAGIWFFYPDRILPYPDPYTPPPAVVPVPDNAPPPPKSSYWYYCNSANQYYPYVGSCPEGWRKVPSAPPDSHE